MRQKTVNRLAAAASPPDCQLVTFPELHPLRYIPIEIHCQPVEAFLKEPLASQRADTLIIGWQKAPNLAPATPTFSYADHPTRLNLSMLVIDNVQQNNMIDKKNNKGVKQYLS